MKVLKRDIEERSITPPQVCFLIILEIVPSNIKYVPTKVAYPAVIIQRYVSSATRHVV